MPYVNNIIIDNAKIIFRNFSGKESKYNRAGNRNFSVIIDDPDEAQRLSEDGWNVKILSPREDGDEPTYYIIVTVSFEPYPPKIYTINSRGKKVSIDEETVHRLDNADIKNVDVEIRPYSWDVNGKSGVKAYLKTMYVTINSDPFEYKYADEEFPEE